MSQELVLHERHGRVGVLTLNRPERKNALVGPLVEDLTRKIVELERCDDVGAIVLRGAGGSFCSGLDLKEFTAQPAPPWLSSFQEMWCELHATIFLCDKPILGALERYAIAGGSGLALACDLLVMGKGAFLHVAEAQRGMAAPMNVAWLRLKIGAPRMYEMLFEAQRLGAQRLERYGLVRQVAPDDEVVSSTIDLAQQIASHPAAAHAATKRIARSLCGVADPFTYFGDAQQVGASVPGAGRVEPPGR